MRERATSMALSHLEIAGEGPERAVPSAPPPTHPRRGAPGPQSVRLATASSYVRPGSLPAPAFSERIVVIAALFVFYHQTPNAWFVRAEDITVDPSNTLAALATLGLIAISFARVAGYLNAIVHLISLKPLVFLFAALALCSMLWSADPTETLRRGLVFFAVTCFAAYLVMRFALDQILALLSWMFALSAAVSLGFVFAFPFYGIDSEGRWIGVFTQKNALGYVAALAIPTLVLAARVHVRWRMAAYGVAAAHTLLLIMSDSKTMLVAGLLPLLLIVLFNGFRARWTLPGAVIVALVGSAVFSLAFATANLGFLTGLLDKDVSLTGRVPMWEGLLPIIGERLLFGHGFDAAFGGFFSPVHDIWIYNQWAGDSHNAYIQILLELGVVGLALFVVAFLTGVWGAIKLVAIVPGAIGLWPIAVMSQALLLSVTESGIQSDSLGWTIYVVALLVVAGHLDHRRRLGLSIDVSDGIRANREKIAVR